MGEWIRFTEYDGKEHCIRTSAISRIERSEKTLYIWYFGNEDNWVYFFEDEKAAKKVLDKLVVSDRSVEEFMRKVKGE